MSECENCGQEMADLRARVKLADGMIKTFNFCDPRCCYTVMYAQLPVQNEPDSFTRLLGGRPTDFQHFCKNTPLWPADAPEAAKSSAVQSIRRTFRESSMPMNHADLLTELSNDTIDLRHKAIIAELAAENGRLENVQAEITKSAIRQETPTPRPAG
jgi:hypothetical protein